MLQICCYTFLSVYYIQRFLSRHILVQLSDFGLAVTDGSQNKNNVKLSGTLGYVAPEYLLDGMRTVLTDKSTLMACDVLLIYCSLFRSTNYLPSPFGLPVTSIMLHDDY